MKRSRSLLTIAALLGLCGLAYRVHTTDEVPAPTAADAHARQAGAAAPEAAELAAIRQELARLRLQVQTQGKGPAADPAGAAKPAAAAPGSVDPEEQQRRRRDYVAGFAAAFRDEVTDLRWSSTAAAAIQAALGDHDLRRLARGAECRSDTCRVELTDDGSNKLAAALPLFLHQVGPELPRVVADRVEDGDGRATLVLYMSRRDGMEGR